MAGPDVDPDAMWKPGYVPQTDPSAPTTTPRPVPAHAPAREDRGHGEDAVAFDEDRDPSDDPAASPRPAASAWARVDDADDGGVELFVPAAELAPAPPHRPRSRRALVGALVAAALVAGAVVVARRGGGGDDTVAALPHVPEHVDVRWSAVLGGDAPAVVAVDGLVVVANRDRRSTLVAYDAASGEVRWTTHLGRADALGEVMALDGALAVTTVGRIPSLQLLDAATGEQRWRRRLRPVNAVAQLAGAVVLIEPEDGGTRFVSIDPATGDALGTTDERARFGASGAVRVDGTTADVFDVQLVPVASDVELDAVPIDAVVVADVVVLSVPGELRAVELTGRERWRMRIEPADARYLLSSGAQDGHLLVVSTSTTTAIDVRGSDAGVVWTVEGLPLIDPSAPGLRHVPIQTGAGSGEVRVLDLVDGSIAATVSLDGVASGRALYGQDGAVLVRAGEDGDWVVRAVEYDGGATRWEAVLRGEPTLVDGGMVGVAEADGATTITYLGAG